MALHLLLFKVMLVFLSLNTQKVLPLCRINGVLESFKNIWIPSNKSLYIRRSK